MRLPLIMPSLGQIMAQESRSNDKRNMFRKRFEPKLQPGLGR